MRKFEEKGKGRGALKMMKMKGKLKNSLEEKGRNFFH